MDEHEDLTARRERRRHSLSDTDILRVREVVRAELHKEIEQSRQNGTLLSSEERDALREIVASHRERRRVYRLIQQAIIGTTAGALALGIAGFIGKALWEKLKSALGVPP